MIAPTGDTIHRLWTRTTQTPDGCWEYTGRRSRGGYGAIHDNGKLYRAHRLAYELAVGPIPDGLVVMHACDNPPCINPGHLSVGTIADNNRDRDEKGRGTPPPAGWMRDLTHCKRGHKFTDANTRTEQRDGGQARICRTCTAERCRSFRVRRNGEPQPRQNATRPHCDRGHELTAETRIPYRTTNGYSGTRCAICYRAKLDKRNAARRTGVGR